MLMQSIHLTSLRLCVFEKTCVSDVPARYVARSNIEAGDEDFFYRELNLCPTKITRCEQLPGMSCGTLVGIDATIAFRYCSARRCFILIIASCMKRTANDSFGFANR